MKCSRCAAELPETPDIITTCPHCGAQLHSNSEVPTEAQTTFSYLPPGAPPWPTRMPLHIPNVVAATSVAPDIPLVVKKTRKKRHSIGSIITSIAILILAPIIGITIVLATLYNQQQIPGQVQRTTPGTAIQTTPSTGGSNNASSGSNSSTSVPTPSSFKTAKDNTVNISLQYPGDWQLNKPSSSSNSSAITLVQSQTSIEFLVIHLTDSSSKSFSSAQQVNQAYLQAYLQYLTNQGIQNVQTGQTSQASPTIGGTTWQQNETTISDGQGDKLHFLSIAVLHGKSYYVINVISPDNLYQDALHKYFTPMFNSVKFLS